MKTGHTVGHIAQEGALLVLDNYTPAFPVACNCSTQANADRLQLTWNCHDQLLTACRCALADLEGLAELGLLEGDKPALLTIAELKAAIESAEPQTEKGKATKTTISTEKVAALNNGEKVRLCPQELDAVIRMGQAVREEHDGQGNRLYSLAT